MTITNHIQRIEALANEVLQHVDRKEYYLAHLLLDGLEMRARLAHEHIDHLQQVTSRELLPAGEN